MIRAKEKKPRVTFATEEDQPLFSVKLPQKYSGTSNGSKFWHTPIPDELLSKIFCYTDHKTLLSCQLVCKHWYHLIVDYIWHKKAEFVVGNTLPLTDKIPWTVFYFICDQRPFYKNLLKNHSGECGTLKHWNVLENGGDGWAVEKRPKSVRPLPKDPVFKGNKSCFVTSFSRCMKEQVINLLDEGFSEYLLDQLQPTIKVSEWFCCQPNVPAIYECTIKLLREQKSDRTAIETLSYSKILEGEQMNHWFKFSHEFKNYGKGLRKIKFCHGGQDRSFIAGSCGTKLAGACIKLEIQA
ncbi:hypothetical protein QAD02_024156 [Eretmocerus hayati]|uniref:Uncharacterized protein n=1 Tax=Eretmocerus hayati TaxID=131215 RepID=A0ACC2Q036_9HYME|nr:hypothetical protein QAD02_024156 [Eretmocerus hayati]